MKPINKIFASRYWWLLLLVMLFVINYLAGILHARFDLTKEKRYTLSKATKTLVNGLEDKVQIDVFLKGEFPAKFRKLTNSVKDILSVLKESNSSKLQYQFLSPEEEFPSSRTTYADSLQRMGAMPINLKAQVKTGESSSYAYPYALISYKGKSELITLFEIPSIVGTESPEKIINSAEALLEYRFANALSKLSTTRKPIIAYSMGNGEPTDARTFGIQKALQNDYNLTLFDLNKYAIPGLKDSNKIDVLMIVKPSKQFTEHEKLKLDQYVMQGGRLLLFIDNLYAEQDSLRFDKETIAFDRNLNLVDQLFKYGVRINTDLVMDLQCDFMPFVVGESAGKPQFEFLKWNYYPLFESHGNHIINRNLGLIASRFSNSIDTIATKEIKKTVLLSSSANSRSISTPAIISLNENRNLPEDIKFNKKEIPVAVLLEGRFTSSFKNRISKAQMDSFNSSKNSFIGMANANASIIVVSDGDMVLNDFSPKEGQPLDMGENFFTKGSQFEYRFANKEFLLNCLEYLTSNSSVIETRNKDIVLRLLDSKKIAAQKSTWQFINIGLPVLLVILFGWIYQQIRKRRYA